MGYLLLQRNARRREIIGGLFYAFTYGNNDEPHVASHLSTVNWADGVIMYYEPKKPTHKVTTQIRSQIIEFAQKNGAKYLLIGSLSDIYTARLTRELRRTIGDATDKQSGLIIL